jgi:outer membrane receptor protein involved in Fe transport
MPPWLAGFNVHIVPGAEPLNAAGYTSTDPTTALLEDLSGTARACRRSGATTCIRSAFPLPAGFTDSGANSSKGKQYHSEFNDDRMASDAYTMVDANLLYTSPSQRMTLNLWSKNLTDELVWAGSYAVASTRTIGGTLMPPRTYGVTLGVRF